MFNSSTMMILKAAAAFVAAVGLLFAIAAHPALAAPAELLIGLVAASSEPITLAGPEARLLAAVGGGVMVGWAAMIWLVVARVAPRDPETARTIILVSAAAWFVVDGVASVAAAAPLNVALNLGFLAMFVLPLLRRSDRRRTAEG